MARFVNLPPDTPWEIRKAFEDLWEAVEPLIGPNNIDLRGRRIVNAGSASDSSDLTTQADVDSAIRAFKVAAGL